jgi:threonyl-tRNA synthetase
MNCPFHVLIYKSQTRSYRDLPMRLSELGAVYRYEKAGVLHGLLRARGFTQDDSHIICTPGQLVDEVIGVFDLTVEILGTFGFTGPRIALSTKPGVAIGDEEMWAKAEDALRQALDKSGMEYELDEGEGAFYGPKVDFHFKDAIGRNWQLTTIQVDFALPERFEMEYAGEDNERHRPVMIHRAILGSIERFSGVLIEHHAGAFPLWLSPEQVRVIPIADRHHEHGATLANKLREAGIRAQVDASSETLNKRIREAQLQKVPYVLVAGDKEIESGAVSVRNRAGEEKRGVPFEDFVARAVAESNSRALETSSFD